MRSPPLLIALALSLPLSAGARRLAAGPAGAGPGRAPAAPRVLRDLARTGRADVLVVFGEQADLRAARSYPSRAARGRFVYDALTGVARRSQRGLRARLEALGVPYRAHYLGNLIRVQVDADLLREITRRPEVDRIDADPLVRFPLPEPAGAPEAASAVEWNVDRVGAPALWALGYDGTGVVVAVQDTGVEWDHPALKGHYRGWNGSSAVHDFHWHDAIDPLNGVPLDDNDHGTHVTGTIVGDDGGSNAIGVAPGAQWIACRNMDHGVGSPGRYTECFEFFLAPYPVGGDPMVDGVPSLAPDAINNSWFCPPSEGCDADTLRSIVEAVRAAGILVVSATGNDGPTCSSVRFPPEIYEASLSVGATDGDDAIAPFSSRGPVLADGSGRLKPDLSAPGVSVRSSVRGGRYGLLSGTSMASPHAVGAAALLLSANPALDGLPDRLEALLLAGARPMPAPVPCGTEAAGSIPNNTFGAGVVFAPDSLASDGDRDGFPLGSDNCPGDANPDQADRDGDGTGDLCDCAPDDGAVFALPGEAGPALHWNPDGTVLSWSAAPGATSHDIYEGSLEPGLLPALGCLLPDTAGTSAPIPSSPEPGEVSGYVVAGRNCFGSGAPGTASDGTQRSLAPACP